MKQHFYLLVVFFFVMSSHCHAQIEVPVPTEPVENIEVPNDRDLSTVQTEVFGYASWGFSNRILIENTYNSGIFADTLGERANEGALKIWSFGIGLRNQIHNNLWWQGGLSLLRNGESYDFVDTDTSFSYQTSYTYIGMPLKLSYVLQFGRLKIYAGGGVVPQMFFRYKQEQQWETKLNSTGDATIKSNTGYNSFAMSWVGNLGIQYYTGSNVAIFVEPEYRHQFISSYTKTDSYQHYGRVFSVNIGLTMAL